MNRMLLKVIFSDLVRVVTFPIRILPVKKSRILFTGLTGGNGYDYSCNPKYIFEYLQNTCPDQFEYVWTVNDKERYSFLKEEGVKIVKHFTVSSFLMLLTSKVIITNGSYVPWFPFRRKQYVINTWHGGGAYKKVEIETGKPDWAAKRMAAFCAGNMDLFVASCKEQEKQMIRGTYRYKGEVLKAGTPRNDKLVLGDIGDMIKKVKKHYKIPQNARVILYAPTYRYAESPVILEADRLLEKLEQDRSEWFFLCRYHRYQKNGMNIHVEGKRIINVADYPDMQELLATADLLITDYSSCVWDYALLDRKCILYVPDRKEYTGKTGFYVDLVRWPFLKAGNMQELLEAVDTLQSDKEQGEVLKTRVREHLEELGSYESGNSRKIIADKIKEQVKPIVR
ncbi:MAG: CDP-glycerol glycerophosphotransferase family protein [Lachnospiraceae bacterium]|nr:CDP-glycerol glycerophosphotransferase family protein [Lachnospiraceae bacterium]